ncbi:Protein of unknown function DUF4487 [Dillenia turbinata]|uniref:Uncharacterized protein n=1 Tax=Dillenia turbinata TaxID=194707 RepID=A0AAN8VH28_9MAGN
MESKWSNARLQSLLEAIKSSDVVESRVQLIMKLGDVVLPDKSDRSYLVECLNTFWEDFTCLDVSQCMLNKAILHVAAKFLTEDISQCLEQFLLLGTKKLESFQLLYENQGSTWCAKHLKMTVMETQDSPEEEHSDLFFKLLLDLVAFSTASFSALSRYPILGNTELKVLVENFVLEQLNLARDATSELKKIHSVGPEVLNSIQGLLDAALKLCRVYSEAVNWEFYNASIQQDTQGMECEETTKIDHVICIIKYTIERFCDLGSLAAKDGGNLVTILNASWKGVVSLLQLGKGALASKTNVDDIILTLVSLARETLRCASDAWSSLVESITVTDARRAFLPVRFYLINAVRISRQYPCQAFSVYKEITRFVLMIFSLKILLSKESFLKDASEVLAEQLEPTSFQLIESVLNSALLKQELKVEVLDWLFDEGYPSSDCEDQRSESTTLASDVFLVTCDAVPWARIFLLPRIALFLKILEKSELDDIKLGMTRKLGWLLNIIIYEEVYASILVLQFPVSPDSGPSKNVMWLPMYSFLVQSLKAFMLLAYSTPAWEELESFLIEYILHPHFLCWEIVMELWCFKVRHAEPDLVIDIFDKICLLFKSVAPLDSHLIPGCILRRLAKSICMLVSSSAHSMVDQVYSYISDDKSQLSLVMYMALLMEGFPLNLLSDDLQRVAVQKIISEYFGFIDNFDVDIIRSCSSSIYIVPVFAMASALATLQINVPDIDGRTLKFMVTMIQSYKTATEQSSNDLYGKLLGETLHIISHMKPLYASEEMDDVVLGLKSLLISGTAASDAQIFRCKPGLAIFSAGLGHKEIVESDKNPNTCAVWEVFHMLLRERHWAFVHLAIAAFGYFAARTSCNELWRFVPQNAALAFDVKSGNETKEDYFMSELKIFLEKEMAFTSVRYSSEQVSPLVNEGSILKEMTYKHLNVESRGEACEIMGIDGENHTSKKRKFPDEISRGVELLQDGLKVMGYGISKWKQDQLGSSELQGKFLSNFSCLEDLVNHLMGLAAGG